MGAVYCMVAGWLECSVGLRRMKKKGRGGTGWGMMDEEGEDDSARLK